VGTERHPYSMELDGRQVKVVRRVYDASVATRISILGHTHIAVLQEAEMRLDTSSSLFSLADNKFPNLKSRLWARPSTNATIKEIPLLAGL
jgi:hypothetical protein